MEQSVSGPVEALLADAGRLAEARGHALVGTEHVLLAMTLQTPDSFGRRVLDDLEVTSSIRERIESLIGPEEPPRG